ncbi:hypothetical protein ERE07_03575 [Allopusillimonas ginsengisoli]|nr:hypothetical protein ERE07_03575 [Allopusillimonas ginsengisoli]
MVAFMAGVGIWGAILFAPVPQALPPALDTAHDPGRDTSAVARWFGGAALRVRVAVAGLITGEDARGTALLSINDGPVRAYGIGQTLAPGVSLAGITANAVSIDQDGILEQVAMPHPPSSDIQGFLPAPPSLGLSETSVQQR